MNLGTPASCRTADVRRYLNEFLMDGHVLDAPWPLRRMLVSLCILPFRPRRSARSYARIWDAAGAGSGSPLLHYSALCRQRLAERLDAPVALAMRYGRPNLASAMAALARAGVEQILLLPLYPQHADATRTTSIEAARAALPPGMRLEVFPPFYDQPAYLDAQAAVIARSLPPRWDHLLFSYHGLPERHLRKADPTGGHCLRKANCCALPSPAHALCYRHQAQRTAALLAERLDIAPERWSLSFQSRLGRLPWLRPYTDQQLRALPQRGARRLAVACPSFVADNLETLEEIGMAGRAAFLDAGGESFTLVPCMNAAPEWLDALAEFSEKKLLDNGVAIG